MSQDKDEKNSAKRSLKQRLYDEDQSLRTIRFAHEEKL